MLQKFYKYHGAGNDFLLADNRNGHLSSMSSDQVRHLCDRHTGFGADGVMLLENSVAGSFRMIFFNPDGSGGMMCGNGGRCIVAFAADLGIIPVGSLITFEAPDGLHQAKILTDGEQSGGAIRLRMRDVTEILFFPDDHFCFLDTGARHVVKFVSGLKDFPVLTEGRILRSDPRFAPAGANVNFIEPLQEGDGIVLHVRTFEKGVEDETLACGTGIVASTVAAYSQNIAGRIDAEGRVTCAVKAAIATLRVDFIPGEGNGDSAVRDIWLTGPADFVGTVEIML